MLKCKFCGGPLDEDAKKCKICNEPFYFMGKVLKWAPLLSIVVTLVSLSFAYSEMRGKEKATVRAAAEQKARFAISQELHAKERAADEALREIAQKLPKQDKEGIIKNLRLRSRIPLEKLEEETKKTPENSNLQRELFLYRALGRPK